MAEPAQRPPERMDYSRCLAEIRARRLRQTAESTIPSPETLPKEEWPPDYVQVLQWRQRQLAMFKLTPSQLVAAHAWYAMPEHTIDFINHWCDTFDTRNAGKPNKLVRMPFILFPRQEELVLFFQALLDADASGLVEKSRDMGATWVAAAVAAKMWRYQPGTAIGFGSNLLEQVDKLTDPSSLLEKIRMLIRWWPVEFWPRGFNPDKHLLHKKLINPENDSIITADGGDDIGRGGRTRMYVVDEAAHLEHPEAAAAALSENTRVRIDISSVSSPGTVFHRTREAGEEWEPGKPVVHDRTNVFIMDWEDHPYKNPNWFDQRKQFFTSQGLSSVFARETERNYAGTQEGSIIKLEWVKAAFNAHKLYPQLGIEPIGRGVAGLDVADEGLDRNALIARKSVVMLLAKEWGDRDTGVTARTAVVACRPFAQQGPFELHYDCIGVGAGVKAETNRLKEEKLLPPNLRIVPWNAGAAVLDPLKRVIIKPNGQEDKDSMRNKEFFSNLKAQGWWMTARRFELTWRLVEMIKAKLPLPPFNPEDLISIDVDAIGALMARKLEKELCQAVVKPGSLKMVVDKAPEGVASPNLADATVMCYWPWRAIMPTVAITGPMIIRGDSE